jgi:hypothetical protein
MSEQNQPSRNSVKSENAENLPKQKVCEKCGAKFDCYSLGGPCWCEEIKLKLESLANLRAQFNDCLCPACLKATASQATV